MDYRFDYDSLTIEPGTPTEFYSRASDCKIPYDSSKAVDILANYLSSLSQLLYDVDKIVQQDVSNLGFDAPSGNIKYIGMVSHLCRTVLQKNDKYLWSIITPVSFGNVLNYLFRYASYATKVDIGNQIKQRYPTGYVNSKGQSVDVTKMDDVYLYNAILARYRDVGETLSEDVKKALSDVSDISERTAIAFALLSAKGTQLQPKGKLLITELTRRLELS